MNETAQALNGIKVLDLSRVLAGPWCTQILADFGADVVKVEAPGKGDDTRAWGPPFLTPSPGDDGPDVSAYYLSCNRNKRSVAVDLASPEGAEIVRRLAQHADVVVENFKVGGLRKYGLDYETLSGINPKLVYCSITGFGQTGPYASRAGYDFVVQAMGGFMSVTGEAEGAPQRAGVAIADVFAGLYSAVSVLLALRHADHTGKGQHIDCALLHTQMAALANQGLSYLVAGTSPGRLGNGHPSIVPYKLFDAKDGSIVIAVGNDSQFKALCEVFGVAHLARDPRYATNPNRVANRETLEAEIQDLVKTWDVQLLTATLADRNVPAGPVNSVAQAFQDPYAAARDIVQHFVRDDGVKIPTVAFPAILSATPATNVRPPPRLGEHTREALKEWLGMADGDLERLQGAGVINNSAR